jgi:hypothetical protein
VGKKIYNIYIYGDGRGPTHFHAYIVETNKVENISVKF